jgi:hypothetical protein
LVTALDLYFIIWGIGLAFTVQVGYDVLGAILEKKYHKNKYLAGIFIILAFLIGLTIFGFILGFLRV